MTTLLLGLLVVLLSVLLAVAGLVLARRWLPSRFFQSQMEAIYAVPQAIAPVYGVAVAFANSWYERSSTKPKRPPTTKPTTWKRFTDLPSSFPSRTETTFKNPLGHMRRLL